MLVSGHHTKNTNPSARRAFFCPEFDLGEYRVLRLPLGKLPRRLTSPSMPALLSLISRLLCQGALPTSLRERVRIYSGHLLDPFFAGGRPLDRVGQPFPPLISKSSSTGPSLSRQSPALPLSRLELGVLAIRFQLARRRRLGRLSSWGWDPWGRRRVSSWPYLNKNY